MESWKQSGLVLLTAILAVMGAAGLQGCSLKHGPQVPLSSASATTSATPSPTGSSSANATSTPVPSTMPFLDAFLRALDAAFLPGSDPAGLLTPFYDLQSGPAVGRLLNYEIGTARQFHDCLVANGYAYRSITTTYSVVKSATDGNMLTVDLQTEVKTQWSPSPGGSLINSSAGDARRMVWMNRGGTFLLAADGYKDQLPLLACSLDPRPPAVTVLPAAPAGTSSPIPLHPGDPAAYAEALTTLQESLDTWRDQGTVAASQFNAVPFDANTPKNVVVGSPLLDGKVLSYSPLQLINENAFTLAVTMELHFPAGAAVPANDGPNLRFVTFARANSGSPFKIVEEATSP